MIDSSKTPVLGSGGYAPGFRHTGVPTHRQSEKEPRCWGALSSGLAWLPTSGGHPPRTWVCPEGNLPHGRGPSLGEISPPPGGHPPPGETRLSRWSRGPTLKHPWAGVKFRASPRPGDRGDLVLRARRGAPGDTAGTRPSSGRPRRPDTARQAGGAPRRGASPSLSLGLSLSLSLSLCASLCLSLRLSLRLSLCLPASLSAPAGPWGCAGL